MIYYILIFVVAILLQLVLSKYMDKVGYGYGKKLTCLALIITGILVIFIYRHYGENYKFYIYSLMLILLITITFIDLTQMIIPDRLNLTMFIIGVINVAINYKNVLYYVGAGLVAGGLFLALALISNGGFGGGDIKLFAPLGLILGFWESILVIIYFFVIAAIFAITLILLKKATPKSTMALAPYISMSVIVYILANDLVINLITSIIS